MKLLILGGTGMIGSALIVHALERGHEVTVLVRSPDKLTMTSPRLTVRTGDPTDPNALDAALPGHDAVLSALGPRTLGGTRFRAGYARVLLAAMERARIGRLIMVSAALLFPDLRLVGRIVAHTLLRNVTRDHEEMEEVIVASPIEWTLVRPPRVTKAPATGRYHVEVDRLPGGGLVISRDDLADFMLAEAERGTHVHAIVGVAA
jgi:putative NADH-flavin reductase